MHRLCRGRRPGVLRLSCATPAARPWPAIWAGHAWQASPEVGPLTFRFVGETGNVSRGADWNRKGASKLWLYNLHYLDDLNSIDADQRATRIGSLIDRWITDNPPSSGNGWEPYPLSLRIVNLGKWFARHGSTVPWRSSLALQAEALARMPELHLLANHLFENGKALVFAGSYLDGADAQRWLRLGLSILDDEVPAQFLADGGHVELSPMYHALMLWGMCDLIQLARSSGLPALGERVPGWCRVLGDGLRWLDAMSHPDGDIAFFNDAAFGIAPAVAQLAGYARSLGVPAEPSVVPLPGVVHLQASGYVAIEHEAGSKTLVDAAQVGCPYQPGHAHADTLSFELSVAGRRILVNGGTSCYGTGTERMRQRSTGAHNTVVVNDLDSSDVWGGFRVGHRAMPRDLDVRREDGCVTVECAHDGYSRLFNPLWHRRKWVASGRRLEVIDAVSGRFDRAVALFHFHPDAIVEPLAGDDYIVRLDDGPRLHVRIEGASGHRLEPATWHPEFGSAVPSRRIVAAMSRGTLKTSVTW